MGEKLDGPEKIHAHFFSSIYCSPPLSLTPTVEQTSREPVKRREIFSFYPAVKMQMKLMWEGWKLNDDTQLV